MASPPHEVEEHHHQQSEIGGSPPTVTVTSPVEEDQEFIDSNMPYSPSLNSVDCQLTEYPVDQPPPPPPPPEVQQVVEIPPSPPPSATELNHDIKEPPLEQPPSPPSSVHEDPPENPNPNPNVESPTENPPPSTAEAPPEKPISKPSSPSPLPPPPEKSTDFDTNPKGESPVAQQVSSPPSEIEDENNNESLSIVEVENNPKPSSRSPSPKSPHKELPLGVPLYNAVTNFIPSKPVISPWTHDETANLIQAYQEKWYAIKKGPLKAGQWEEVAVTVAARCGYEEPTKTSKQCRHKMEKLRKRYRQERGKPRSRANAWDFFKMMDNLEKGPLPISSSPMEVVEYGKPSDVNGKKRRSNAGVWEAEFLASKRSARVRNSNSNERGNVNGSLVGTLPFSDGVSRIVKGLRTPVVHKPREYYQASYGVQKKVEEEEEDDGGSDNGGDEGVVTQLAAEIKGFAEKFVRMEKNKIEMIRDVERYRMEMENKRMEMIRESQQMLVETVNRAFGGSNKTHRLSAK